MLRRQRAIEILPSSKPLRWRRYDVPQHLAPETSDALRLCAVEGDLELLDRRHRSTIAARPSHRRTGRGPVLLPQLKEDHQLGKQVAGLDAGPIPVTVPELRRLLRDTVIPPPRRDRAHRPCW